MDALSVTKDTPQTADVAAVLQLHHAAMRAGSPAESCHVMDADELLSADAVLFAARKSGAVLGVGAIKALDAVNVELKSMHTVAAARGQGVARAILDSLIQEARALGFGRMNLETGTAQVFAPARALYTAYGFAECPPFGDYRIDPLSVYMSRAL